MRMKEKGKMKSEKVRTSLLFTFSLLLFTFLANAVDLPAGYTAVEYIESMSGGGQYIDTGYTPNANTKVVCRMLDKGTDTSVAWGAAFGVRKDYSWQNSMYKTLLHT